MPPKRQGARAEGAASTPAAAPAAPAEAEPEPEEEEQLQSGPAAAPAATAEEGTPEAPPETPSGASGGQYGPIMRRRLKKFLAIVEADEGWECVASCSRTLSHSSDIHAVHTLPPRVAVFTEIGAR